MIGGKFGLMLHHLPLLTVAAYFAQRYSLFNLIVHCWKSKAGAQ
jgi:hypothetical protein